MITAGGFADSLVQAEAMAKRMRQETDLLARDWPGYIDYFMSCIFSEPHSTKPYEDGVRYGWATDRDVIQWVRQAWINHDLRDHARRVTLPHAGDPRRRRPPRAACQRARDPRRWCRARELLTIGGGGHVTAARDPVSFNRAVRDFVAGAPATRSWVRGMKRQRKALFISSPIGLGHVQRDLAIARELRKLQPDLQIDWFTVDPAARYLEREGEKLHPITKRLANESQHFEGMAGEHDLSAFFALRTMDEIMTNNFMTFVDLMEAEHYDLVIGDEAWDVDYYYHENPELKRQPFVFLTDFVGCLPMEPGNEREALLCADRNADDIEHVARYPYLRDAAIFVGNRDDVTEQPFGPGLPGIRDWTDKNFCYCGYCLPFDPKTLADTERLRALHGYRADEKVAIAAVGGTSTGRHLLQRIAQAFPRMKRAAARAAPDPGGRPASGPEGSSAAARARGQALRAQPVRTPRVLRPGAGARRPVDHDGAGRHAPTVPQLSAAAPLRAVRARAAAPGQLPGRPLARLRHARPRHAGRARAERHARAGALPAGGDRWRAARRAAHRAGARQPRVGALTAAGPHRSPRHDPRPRTTGHAHAAAAAAGPLPPAAHAAGR